MKALGTTGDKVSSSVGTIRSARKSLDLGRNIINADKNISLSICSPFNTEGALERAKYAVESQYAVVGVLEDFNTTLTVLEKYIPKFFGGATSVYYGVFKKL